MLLSSNFAFIIFSNKFGIWSKDHKFHKLEPEFFYKIESIPKIVHKIESLIFHKIKIIPKLFWWKMRLSIWGRWDVWQFFFRQFKST